MTEKEALQKSVAALSKIIKPKPPVEEKVGAGKKR